MTKKILCKKLNEELPALQIPPMPGPKGIELMESISEESMGSMEIASDYIDQ